MKIFGKELFGHGSRGNRSLRYFLHYGNGGLDMEVSLYRQLGLKVSFNDEGSTLAVGLGLFSIYLTLSCSMVYTFSNWLLKSKKSRYDASVREYGLMICGHSTSLFFHHDDSGMSDHRGWYYSLWMSDIVKPMVKEKTLEQSEVAFPISFNVAGEDYLKDDAKFLVVTERYTTRYKVFGMPVPLVKRISHRAKVECIGFAIAFAGKGENSWDCDDGFMKAISFPIESPDIGSEDLVKVLLENAVKSIETRGSAKEKFPPVSSD